MEHWDYDNWITDIRADFNTKSLKQARENLLDKIKNLHGVEIITTHTGKKYVKVIGKNGRVYYYTIHAFNCLGDKVVGEREVKSIFAPPRKEPVYERGYSAYLERYNKEGIEL